MTLGSKEQGGVLCLESGLVILAESPATTATGLLRVFIIDLHSFLVTLYL